MQYIGAFLYKKRVIISVFLLFVVHVYTRFWQIPEHYSFGWDQIDNAWVAADMIDHHIFPERGMVAKASTGFHIGPAYYYYVAAFYALTNLDPIASGIIAAVTSIITFWAVYGTIRTLFNPVVALLAMFFHTYSDFVIIADRSQWPVNFIVPLSAGIVLALYRVLTGSSRYIILLALLLGASLHIHVTTVFFFIITFFCIPFFPWRTMRLSDVAIATVSFAIILFPVLTQYVNTETAELTNASGYVATTYHGFHLRRMMQIAPDAVIEFSLIFSSVVSPVLRYIVIPAFAGLLVWSSRTKKSIIISALAIAWMLVPWIVFTTYSGELTNYYFYMTRPVILMAVGYLLYRLIRVHVMWRVVCFSYLIYFAVTNISQFIAIRKSTYLEDRMFVREEVLRGTVFPRREGDAKSYYYYVETRKQAN